MHIKTLQKMVIKDAQYLMYYLRKHKTNIQEYKHFCSGLQLSHEQEEYISHVLNTCSIDLYPYLYTAHIITTTEFNSFLIYYIQHASYVDINVDKVLDIFTCHKDNSDISNIDKLLGIIMNDTLLLISLLSVMQYYFI
jgi:hypothetical protein